MPSVRVRDNEPFEIAMRRFKRTCEKAGILAEVHKREFYEKPTQVRKRKAAAAVKRHQKKVMKELNRRIRLYWTLFYPCPSKSAWKLLNPLLVSATKQRINDDVKAAMRSRDKDRLGVLRLITAAFKQKEVDERIELDDAMVLAIMDKMVKQIRDSIQQFEQAGRDDLVEKEKFELEIIQEYLPAQLSEDEIKQLIAESITESGAESVKDMGKVMGILKSRLQGRADMGQVSGLVKQQLG